jgi:hypothetical protein
MAETALGEDRVSTIRYDSEAVNYTDLVDQASSKLQSLNERFSEDHIAILLVSKEEVSTIIREAGTREGLFDVAWIAYEASEDPYTLDSDLHDTAQWPTTDVAGVKLIGIRRVPLIDNDILTRLQSGYVATKPSTKDKQFGIMEASFYDSVWVACLSVLKANTTDANILKETIPKVALKYTGASGNVILDINGDRAVDYDVYQASEVSGTVGWVKVGRYGAITGQTILSIK